MIGFLLDMRIDPTREYNNSSIQLSNRIYSTLHDSDIKKENDRQESLAEEQLKREILEEITKELYQPPPESSNAGSDDLSDWSLISSDEEDDHDDNHDIPTSKGDAEKNIPEALELSEPPPLDEEALKLSWKKASKEAMDFLQENVRQCNLTSLTNQPVISNVLDFQVLFGQFWEWRKSHKLKDGRSPKLQIISEADIIREILWQFTSPKSLNSPIFTNDWSLKSNIMISTLSQATLGSTLGKYGKILSIVENLRKFVQCVEMKSSSNMPEIQITKCVPKVFQIFSAGISKILMEVSLYAGCLEKELNFGKSSNQSTVLASNNNFNSRIKSLMVTSRSNDEDNSTHYPSTTLLQLDRNLRNCVLILQALEEIFVKSVGDLNSSVQFSSSHHWFMSIKLISTLEMALSTESRVQIWRLNLFLFSTCLHAYLDEFLSPLETLEWSDNSSLFSRNRDAHINDSNFWTNSITIQPYKEKLADVNILPLSCLEEAVPKMLSVLKTLEMLRQLDEDFTIILGQLPSARHIVREFLLKIKPISLHSGPENNFLVNDSRENIQSIPDYQKCFEFLPLHNNLVISSFNSLLKNEIYSQPKCPPGLQNKFSSNLQYENCDNDVLTFENFVKFPEIPYSEIKHVLCSVIQRFINPIVSKGHRSLGKIFHDYKVDESMRIFREIILGAREDFAQSVVKLATSTTSSRFKFEDSTSRDPLYQQLLLDCYPEGRDRFDIHFHLDPKSDMNCKFIVTPKFPVNLILSNEAINGYLNVSKQLHRIRKSLWTPNNLQMKECKTIEGVELNRAFLLRFALIHFCSSLRAFFMLKVFSNNYNVSTVSTVQDADLDQIIKTHEAYLQKIELHLLKIKLMESIIIKKMVVMSGALNKTWRRGIPMKDIITLEDCLKKCWSVVNDFSRSGCSTDFNELYYHLGPPPSYL